jgi:hypothetical protein
MADNFAFTPGSGATGAADDIGGVLHPRVKNTWGPDGTANDVDVASGKPMPVQLRGSDGTDRSNLLPVTPAATESHLGEVGGKSVVTTVTLTTDTAAYASGDLIADTQQIDGFFRKADGTGVINSITIIDEEAQGLAFYLIFMSTSTSLGSENSAPNITDANFSAGCQGIIPIAASDWITVSGTRVCTLRNIGLPVKAASGTDDLYIACLNATGAPDWDADSLVVKIGAFLD